MSKVKAPRKPGGEPLKITIANQDRQIRLLTDRIVDLAAARDRAQALSDENYENGKSWKTECAAVTRERDDLRWQVSELAALNSYNNGYIARVKEMDARSQFPGA